jgi:hypothetical protein
VQPRSCGVTFLLYQRREAFQIASSLTFSLSIPQLVQRHLVMTRLYLERWPVRFNLRHSTPGLWMNRRAIQRSPEMYVNIKTCLGFFAHGSHSIIVALWVPLSVNACGHSIPRPQSRYLISTRRPVVLHTSTKFPNKLVLPAQLVRGSLVQSMPCMRRPRYLLCSQGRVLVLDGMLKSVVF